MPNTFTKLQSAVFLTLMATFLAALFQFKNQIELHRETPNSAQRKLCFVAASFIVAMVVENIVLLFVYVYALLDGLPSGRLDPGEWPISVSVLAIIGFILSYIALLLIVLASLHRYQRLCSVEENNISFRIAKIGSFVAAPLAFLCNSISGFLVQHIILSLTQSLCIGWLLAIDFYANFSVKHLSNHQMISRVLQVKAIPRGQEGNASRNEWEKQTSRRKILRRKLLAYFGLSLVVNFINLISYASARFLLTQYFVEINLINSCGLAMYLILNLYFLDVLRDGVLNPPETSDSSIDGGNFGVLSEYPARHAIVELVSR
jgi:hypothetical protein